MVTRRIPNEFILCQTYRKITRWNLFLNVGKCAAKILASITLSVKHCEVDTHYFCSMSSLSVVQLIYANKILKKMILQIDRQTIPIDTNQNI